MQQRLEIKINSLALLSMRCTICQMNRRSFCSQRPCSFQTSSRQDHVTWTWIQKSEGGMADPTFAPISIASGPLTGRETWRDILNTSAVLCRASSVPTVNIAAKSKPMWGNTSSGGTRTWRFTSWTSSRILAPCTAGKWTNKEANRGLFLHDLMLMLSRV